MRVLPYRGPIQRFLTGLSYCRGPVAWLAVSLILVQVSLPLSGQSSPLVEYRSKANYLAKFPAFVEWPAEAWLTEKAPFVICVFGEYPFGTSLAEVTRGTTVHERKVEIRWIRKTGELHGCHVLFVSRSEQKRYGQVLEAVQGKMVFTVGETPEFLDAGGMVSFSTQDESIRFDVNLGEVSRAHLKISSHLLVLARRVVNQPEVAKS
jgi:hypothetical protein